MGDVSANSESALQYYAVGYRLDLIIVCLPAGTSKLAANRLWNVLGGDAFRQIAGSGA